MPPTRRRLCALGSLPLLGHANNPTKVVAELAYRADEHSNARGDSDQKDSETPFEVQFDEFMDGVNSRGKGTKIRQRKTTAEQAAAVLLLTVQKGYVDLIAKADDPHAIDVIKILPRAKRILATFLPKLRGYGDIPYDYQYRGAIALAKRHFFPNGKAPTKKELMALLLQSYQEKRELGLQSRTRLRSTQALGIQTSVASLDGLSHTKTASSETAPSVHPPACSDAVEIAGQSNSASGIELPNDVVAIDVEPTPVASEADPDVHDDYHDAVSVSEHQAERTQHVAATPVASRSFNPYMTPVSNPRRVDQTTNTLFFNTSPTPATNSSNVGTAPNEDGPALDEARELLQTTARYQGTLEYWYNAFIAACRAITSLEGEKDEIQKKFDTAKKKLGETEQRLREANADRSSLKRTVQRLGGLIAAFTGQCQEMTKEIATHNLDEFEI